MVEVKHVRIRMTNGGGTQTYDNARITTFDWGIHITADDQEDMIPWHSIEQIGVVN